MRAIRVISVYIKESKYTLSGIHRFEWSKIESICFSSMLLHSNLLRLKKDLRQKDYTATVTLKTLTCAIFYDALGMILLISKHFARKSFACASYVPNRVFSHMSKALLLPRLSSIQYQTTSRFYVRQRPRHEIMCVTYSRHWNRYSKTVIVTNRSRAAIKREMNMEWIFGHCLLVLFSAESDFTKGSIKRSQKVHKTKLEKRHALCHNKTGLVQ